MAIAAVAFIAAFAVAGCGKKKPETEVNVDPPDLLYNQALANLEAGDASEASEKFEAIDREHPYSDEARKAMIMSAFLNFRRGKYQDAINDAERYVTLFPASEDAAYAQYLIGESYFRQIPDVTRDQDLAKKAMDAMGEVIAKYPDSEYANDAHNKIDVALDQIAGKEMQIGRYYEERHEYPGCRQPLPHGRGAIPDDAARGGGTVPSDRDLSGARHRPGGADGRRRARA